MKGRKEQVMRQWYYYQEAVKNVNIDSNEINKEFRVAGRTYQLSYFSLPENSVINIIRQRLQDNPNDFDSIFKEVVSDKQMPEKEIKYGIPENIKIYNRLFLNSVQKGQVFGPLKVEDGTQLVIRVNGWIDELVLSDQQVLDRWNTVKENITHRKAMDIYEQKVLRLMGGKIIEFNKDTFFALVDIVGPDYFKTEEEKKQKFRKKFWNEDSDEMVIDDQYGQLERIRDKKLFTIDGIDWTVHDLQLAFQYHPPVFRKKNFPKNEFGEQLKFAIVDMIRDKYITEDAYKKGYDKVEAVSQNVQMWQDNMLALYQKQNYLKSANIQGKDKINTITKILDPYVKQLLEKYNDDIKINVKEFEDVKLTKIDMFVIQENVPFPVIVPAFPQITTYNRLDYGQELNK